MNQWNKTDDMDCDNCFHCFMPKPSYQAGDTVKFCGEIHTVVDMDYNCERNQWFYYLSCNPGYEFIAENLISESKSWMN